MGFGDTLIAVIVILGILIMVWSRMKNQGLKDTFDEIKSIMTREEEE